VRGIDAALALVRVDHRGNAVTRAACSMPNCCSKRFDVPTICSTTSRLAKTSPERGRPWRDREK
jgi:hypothetical protein